MKPHALVCLTLLYLFAALPSAAAERSPFEEPAAPPQALFNYKAAKKQIEIIGLITTDTNAKVIVRTNPERPPAVYSKDSRIIVTHNGVDHTYRIVKIKNRSILLKAGNGETCEVEVD